MPKLKTHKATIKRFKISRPKKHGKKWLKLIQRSAGQDHFNARESGDATKRKRRDRVIHKSNVSSIKKLIPYR